MSQDDVTTAQLKRSLAKYERNSRKTSWLLRQLWRKISLFPRDLSRRIRRSVKKRLGLAEVSVAEHQKASRKQTSGIVREITAGMTLEGVEAAQRFIMPFHVSPERHGDFGEMRAVHPGIDDNLERMVGFIGSAEIHGLIAEAARFDPEVGMLNGYETAYCPPWHDMHYLAYRRIADLVPPGLYDSVVLMPAGRMGGADLVAAVLARALAESDRVLILRTDDSHWDRPDWYPEDVTCIDLSPALKDAPDRERALYVLLTEIAPKRVYNVNSRLAFETFVAYGPQLAAQARLYAYYFCADRTEAGIEIGYPVWFFSNIMPHLSAAMIDTHDLAQTLIERHAVPAALSDRVVTLYTPAQTPIAERPAAAGRGPLPEGERPRVLWAGRLDRQKRFDIVVAIARAMPDVDFLCWGKAVLDAPPDVDALPGNLVLKPPFTSYDELPLAEAEGWLYTSDWDGLPTILIELGALGVPIVASGVGGVPELITPQTGWTVPAGAEVQLYVEALRDMIGDPQGRVAKAKALQRLVASRHSVEEYVRNVGRI